MADNNYTSEERLYLDREGKVVGEKDPNKHTLLVGKGGSLPMERARELGLVDEEGEAVEREDAPAEADADGADSTAEEAEAKPAARKATTKAAAKKK